LLGRSTRASRLVNGGLAWAQESADEETRVQCALSTGTGFGPATLWTDNFSNAGGWHEAPFYYSTISLPDVNSDGRADVCGRSSKGIFCGLSSGAGFGAVTQWTNNFANAGSWHVGPQYYGTIRFPDVNGDRRADVCGRGNPGIFCALSTGSAFGPVTLWTNNYADAGSWNAGPQYYATIRFPDLNADGRADVCGRGNTGIHCALSSGSAFGAVTQWTNNYADAGAWNAGPQYYGTLRLPDLNGDGRSDVCGRGNGGIFCSLSSGTAFGSVDLWTAAYRDDDGWAEGPHYYSTIRFP
jgi:hypothetical protein